MEIISFISLLLDGFGFAGGGGSGGGGGGGHHSHSSHSGSGGSFGEPWDTILTVVMLVFYAWVFIHCFRVSAKERKAKKLAREKYSDKDRDELKQARNIFVQYQMDWSNLNCENMKSYMTDEYYQHACLMLEAISSMHRQNLVSDLRVKEYDFEGYKNVSPRKNICFTFAGRDMLYDKEKQGYIINQYVSSASETWQFVEGKDGKLLLDKIIQPTRSSAHTVKALNDFRERIELN